MPELKTLSSTTSDYSPDTERRVENLLNEIYDLLQIQKPSDLYGSVVIEARYQAGKPSGQLDVNVRYVMKRTATNGAVPKRRRNV